MIKLLELAVAEAAKLPADQQEAVAGRLLDEVRRRVPGKRRWAEVADRLAGLDALRGQSEAFIRHVQEHRAAVRMRDAPAD